MDAAVGTDADVVVAGLGPTGVVLALLLARAGLRVLAVDAATGIHPHPRAVAVDDDVLRILQPLAPVTVNGWQRAGFLTPAGRLLLDVGFGETEVGHPALAFVHQPTLEASLRAALHDSGATVVLGSAVSLLADRGDRVEVAVGAARARARWLVACDGASSPLRTGLGIPWLGRADPRPWLVIDAAVDAPLTGWPYFRYLCDPGRPGVTMPFPGGHRWEFRLRPGEDPDPGELIAPYVGDTPGVRITRSATYTFAARTAGRWRDGRVLLAGDAAHTMPPFAGQGMGAGIRDAAQLAWRLAELCLGAAHETDPLAAWEAERRRHVRQVVRLSRLLGGLVQTRHAGSRDLLLSTAARTPGLGSWLRRGGPRPPSGPRLPNPRLRLLDGTVDRLDDLLPQRWQHFSTVGATGGPDAAVLVVPPGGRTGRTVRSTAATVEDLDGTLLALLRARGGHVLARPDRLLAQLPER